MRTRCVLLLFLLLSTPAWATTYYVDPAGSDSNPGTSGSPWLTIQRCVTTVGVSPDLVAGDTCLVKDGTYTDTDGNHITVYIDSNAPQGASGSPITIKSENYLGAVVIVPGDTGQQNFGFRVTKNYYVIEGFDITGNGATSLSSSSDIDGITISGSTGVTIRHNRLHDIARTICSNSGSGFNGIAVSSTLVTIENNVFYTIGRLRGNLSESGCTLTPGGSGTSQNDHGIYATNTTDLTVRRNIFYDTNRGYPLHFFGGTNTRVSVYNNTFHGKSPDTVGTPYAQVLIGGAWSGASAFKNNIFSDPKVAPFQNNTPTGSGTIALTYNLTDSTDADWFRSGVPSQVTGGDCTTGCIDSTSPGFTAVGSNDFTLAAGSGAIGTGTTATGVTCNATCDIGAFETVVFASCVIEDGDATHLRVTFTNNAAPPLLPATGITTFTARKDGANNPVTAAVRTGDNRVDLTVTAYANGNAADISWASGNLTDSSLIGGTLNQGYKTVLTNQACTNNVGAGTTYVFTQAAFEFHGLRGTEAAPVGTPYATAPENTNILVRVGGSVRLRLAITCTTSDCPPTGFFPYYSKNAGAYTLVPDVFAADNFAMCGTNPDPDIPTNGTATTDQLSTSGTFAPGAVVRTSNAIPTVDMALNGKTELEYCFSVDTDATATDTYDIRVRQQDGTVLNTYTVTPRMTLAAPSAGMGF